MRKRSPGGMARLELETGAHEKQIAKIFKVGRVPLSLMMGYLEEKQNNVTTQCVP